MTEFLPSEYECGLKALGCFEEISADMVLDIVPKSCRIPVARATFRMNGPLAQVVRAKLKLSKLPNDNENKAFGEKDAVCVPPFIATTPDSLREKFPNCFAVSEMFVTRADTTNSTDRELPCAATYYVFRDDKNNPYLGLRTLDLRTASATWQAVPSSEQDVWRVVYAHAHAAHTLTVTSDASMAFSAREAAIDYALSSEVLDESIDFHQTFLRFAKALSREVVATVDRACSGRMLACIDVLEGLAKNPVRRAGIENARTVNDRKLDFDMIDLSNDDVMGIAISMWYAVRTNPRSENLPAPVTRALNAMGVDADHPLPPPTPAEQAFVTGLLFLVLDRTLV